MLDCILIHVLMGSQYCYGGIRQNLCVFLLNSQINHFFVCFSITTLSLLRKNYVYACSWFETTMLNNNLGVVWSLSMN
jgi:hypothetical protein